MRDSRRSGAARPHEQKTEAEIAAAVEAAIIEELLEIVDEKFRGSGGRIYFYRETPDSSPAKIFMSGLPTSAKASYAASFTRHCNGERVRGTHHHIWEEHDSLWAYKHRESKTRIMHTMEKINNYVLLFGFDGKKEDKVETEHVNRAVRMQAEYKRRRDEIETRVRSTFRTGGMRRG